MKLSEIQDMWGQDAKVDMTNLGQSAARVPELHSKYLKLLTNTKLQVRKIESEFLRLKRAKTSYYRGELSQEELQELGWDQYLRNRPLKNEMEDVLNSDEDIIASLDKLEYLKTVHYQLEQILKSINSRTWDIKTAVQWHTFTQGNY